MGSAVTHLEVINNTNTDITSTSVWGLDNFDWDRTFRPDHNFQNVFIGSKRSAQRREVLNKIARNCPFTMKLHFHNGNVDTFRIHQKYALGCCASFEHSRRSHNIYYERHDYKVVIRVENTEQQLQNERAEERNGEGVAAMRQKLYDAAMKKFDEALRLANEGGTVNSIKSNKSITCYQMGNKNWEEGWHLESDSDADRSKEAERKFSKARSLFKEADSLKHSFGAQKSLNLVNLKIDANRIFNEANALEGEAFKLFQSADGDYTQARGKYREVLVKYEEAKKKFEEGVNKGEVKFGDCVKIVNEHIDSVKQVINDIDKERLNQNIEKINTDDKSEEEEDDDADVDINIKLHEQVDIVTH